MVNKNNNKNSSNSFVFGLWLQTKMFEVTEKKASRKEGLLDYSRIIVWIAMKKLLLGFLESNPGIQV